MWASARQPVTEIDMEWYREFVSRSEAGGRSNRPLSKELHRQARQEHQARPRLHIRTRRRSAPRVSQPGLQGPEGGVHLSLAHP